MSNQHQGSTTAQLNELAELAKAANFSATTIARILHGNMGEKLEDTKVRSELLQCVSIANANGLYDAADCIRYNVLGLK